MPTPPYSAPDPAESYDARPFLLLPLLLSSLVAANAAAQCTTTWNTGAGAPGVQGLVFATATWDPDGPGGVPEGVLVGGEFAVAGKELASNVALYTPATGAWSSLGAGAPGRVLAIAALRREVAIAYGTTTVITIALWDGTAWTNIGMTSGAVNRLAFNSNGELFAAGSFFGIGTVAAASIARWDRTAWHPLGSGTSPAFPIAALLVLPNDDVVAGGAFPVIGGGGAQHIAQWNGSVWQALGPGCVNPVRDVVRLPTGDLLASTDDLAGGFLFEQWNGAAWTVPAGAPSTGVASHMAVMPNGDVYASGAFGAAVPMTMVRWNGVAWQVVVGTSAMIGDLAALATGSVVAGVTLFWTATGIPALGTASVGNVAIFDGTNWSATGDGFNDPVLAIAPAPNGVAIGGGFSRTPGGGHAGVVGWDGSSWSGLTSGVAGQVRALRRFADGSLVAVGSFARAGAVPAESVARWNGSAWSAVGTSLPRHLNAVAELPTGHPVVGGAIERHGGSEPYVATFDGTSWTELPAFDGSTFALAVLPNGDIVAGGNFTTASGSGPVLNRVARWNGTAWSAVGSGFDDAVIALRVLPNGDIAAAGDFTFAGPVVVNHVARWNGTAWSAFGTGLASNGALRGLALEVLPGGDLVVGGSFTVAGGVSARNVARWNGTAWAAVDQGVDGDVNALQVSPWGTLLAGGTFQTAGGRRSVSLAELATSCASTVASYGTPCTSPALGGPLLASATTLAWIGETFHARCPAAANAFAVGVWGGAATSMPLALIDPSAVPGCLLVASPDVLVVLAASGGEFASSVAVPGSPALIGGSWFHQIVQFVLGAGSFAEVAGSQGLQLTFGSF